MKCYEAIAQSLEVDGVKDIFAVMGDGNMALLSSVMDQTSIRVHFSRHENSAMAMAAAYARTTGKVGVCSATQGPGLTSLLTALVSASRSGTPVVLILGDIGADDRLNIQRISHELIGRCADARWHPLRSLDTVQDDVRLAFHSAELSQTPVIFNCPIDIQESEYVWEVDSTYNIAPDSLTEPDPQRVIAVADQLVSANRPVIVAGMGSIRANAREEIRALGSKLGALLSTSLPAKGLFAGDPFDAGIAGLFSSEAAHEIFSVADCVVGVGASLNYYTMEGGFLFPNAKVIQLDTQTPSRLDGGVVPDVFLRGDAKRSVQALLRELEKREHTSQGFRNGDVAQGLQLHSKELVSESPEGYVDPREAMRVLDDALPHDSRIAIGVGHFWEFAVMHLNQPKALPYILTYEFGSIGDGIPAGIGAAIADSSSPVIAIEGDSSAMMHLGELETAVRLGVANLCIVIMNDGGPGAEYHKLAAKGFVADRCLMPVDGFASVAQGLGMKARTVSRPTDLAEAISRHLAEGGPSLIDVRITREAISEPFQRLNYAGRNAS